jgi:hypothetical protein
VTGPCRRPAYNSRARLDALCLVVMVERATVETGLEPFGLVLAEVPGAPFGVHPVCLEIWRVRDGQAIVGSVDQHRLYQQAGQSWAGAFGRRWSQMMGGAGRALSEALAATVGTYDEVMVAVPDCCFPGDPTLQRYYVVLGMFADSAVAIWGDWSMRCGYQKRPGLVRRGANGGIDVVPMVGPSLAAARWQPAAPGFAGQAGGFLGRWPAWFEQPLLGRLDRDRVAVTFLERDLANPETVTGPQAGRLSHTGPFLPGLPEGDHQINPVSEADPFGAIHSIGLPVMVTYPLHFVGVPWLDAATYSPAPGAQ